MVTAAVRFSNPSQMGHFENIPPEAIPEMAEALAMLGAFGGGATVGMSDLLAARPDLVRRFEQLDPVIAAVTFGGLLTVSDLQANGVRVGLASEKWRVPLR